MKRLLVPFCLIIALILLAHQAVAHRLAIWDHLRYVLGEATAEFSTATAIVIKDRIRGRTPIENIQQLKSSNSCQWCNLAAVSLNNVDLNEVDLRGANLRNANLSGSNLSSGLFERSNLSNANLSGSNLRGAQFANVYLRGINLSKVDLSHMNLQGLDLSRADLTESNLRGANLTRAVLLGANLSNADLSGAKLTKANLTGADLTGAIVNATLLINADLTDVVITQSQLSSTVLCNTKVLKGQLTECDLVDRDLTGINLTRVNLSGGNLTRADLFGADLTKADLSGSKLIEANLSEADLTEADLTSALLNEAYLYETNLTKANLSNANLGGTRLTGANFTDANLSGAISSISDEIKIGFYEKGEVIATELDVQISGVISMYFDGDFGFLVSSAGILYKLEQGKIEIVLDWNKYLEPQSGRIKILRHVATSNNFVYTSYIEQEKENDKIQALVVEEYTIDLIKTRTIFDIQLDRKGHVSGALSFDEYGKLYVSVGDSDLDQMQYFNPLPGKILRFDVSKNNPEPEVIAYGLRSPWKISIDSDNRMFIGDCGASEIESIYLLNDLYSTTPFNLGWPVFEGTNRMVVGANDPYVPRVDSALKFEDTLPPIYEYRHHRGVGGCAIGGFFLDELDGYLFGDYFGQLRLLRERDDGKWKEIYFQATSSEIWSFGYEESNNRVYMSTPTSIYELDLKRETIVDSPKVILCRTKMPDRSQNKSGC